MVFDDLLSFAYDLLDLAHHDKGQLQAPIKFKYPLDLNFAIANFPLLFINIIRSCDLHLLADEIKSEVDNKLPIEIKSIERKSPLRHEYGIKIKRNIHVDEYQYPEKLKNLYSLLYQRLNENISYSLNKNYIYRKRAKPIPLSRNLIDPPLRASTTFYYDDRTNQTINSRVKRFTFENIRNFKPTSSLEFSSSKSIVLIGENGVGKSSFLELVRKSLGSKNYSLNNLISLGKNSTTLTIDFDNDLLPTIISQNGRKAIAKNKHTTFNVINIGEQRLSKSEIQKKLDFIIDNKFSDEIIDLIGFHLKFLFDLPVDSELMVVRNTVVILECGNEKPIEHYSSGYMSIFSIYMSIIMNVIKLGGIDNYKINIANSIILIDELELHLHPKFKKEIMRKLNITFPETLIFATTHDPLVLSSCTENDKIVTFRDNGEYTIIDDQLPNVSNYSIEQILTSPIFGLSTVNRHLGNIEKIEKYHTALKNKDWDLVDQLQDELADSGYFGNSYREFLAHSIVDLYNSEGITATKGELVDKLKQSEADE